MTTNGSAPRTAAEAFASAESARTLACSRLRSRSTPERLPSASERLPPACAWMAMTMAKKRTSGIGMRSIMRSKASLSGTPTRCCSTSSVNSPDTGCGDSRAMMPRHSGSGRPDLTPRTMTSMALANSSMNLVWRRLVIRARIQRGRPSAPTNSPSSGTIIGRFGADAQMLAATIRPQARLATQNERVEKSSPARCRRKRMVIFSRAFCRSSKSFSVSATWRRRLCAASACAFTAMRVVRLSVTPWMRLSARRSPERYGLTSRKTTAPIDSAASTSRPISSRSLLSTSIPHGIAARVVHLGRRQRLRQPHRLAVVLGALPEARAGDARGAMAAGELAVRILARDLVDDQVLQGHHVPFHTHHLGDVGDLARAVAQTRGLDDDVDGPGDHLADGLGRQLEAAHHDHRFQAADGLARAVGMQRAHRAVVAGVHGLQQVEGLRPAHLADDDALGAHAQAVAHQVAHGDLAFALEVGRAGLQAHDVGLLQLQLGGVLAGDDALVVIDGAGEAVEQGGLARAGATGDQHVATHAADDLQERLGLGRDRFVLEELLELEPVLLELADCQRRPIDGQRRRDHVDAAAVGKAGIADRARFVDTPADLTDDALADVHQLSVVGKAHRRLLHLAGHLDVGGVGAVDHDVGDVVAGEQRLERAVAQHVVADVL